MLPPRVGVLLVPEQPQRVDQARAGVGRFDHVINVATLGGKVGVGELLPILGILGGQRGFRVGGFGNLLDRKSVV